MADKGKRLIFSDDCQLPAQEGIATAAIRPGALVVQSASGLTESTNAATVFGTTALFADYNFLEGKDVDTSWEAGNTAVARQPGSNKQANVLVATGQTISARGVAMSSNGDGTLKIAATDGTEQVLAVSDEIITTTAVTLVRVRGMQ
jgi:hypothetical protein